MGRRDPRLPAAGDASGRFLAGRGPPVLWRRELGDGSAAIAAVGGRLYTSYRRGADEVVVALDRASGTTVWEHARPQPIWDGFLADHGCGPLPAPRPAVLATRSWTVPTLVDGILYARDRREIVALDLRAD